MQTQTTDQAMIEYAILLYNRGPDNSGQATTIIGFATPTDASRALHDACAQHEAMWGYLVRADGEILEGYRAPLG